MTVLHAGADAAVRRRRLTVVPCLIARFNMYSRSSTLRTLSPSLATDVATLEQRPAPPGVVLSVKS